MGSSNLFTLLIKLILDLTIICAGFKSLKEKLLNKVIIIKHIKLEMII